MQNPLILDGGLATQLEARGHKLDSRLWSALLLVNRPSEIQAVHRDYLRAGADVITTASYQATLPGFHDLGMDDKQAVNLLQDSVRIARFVRDQFWEARADDVKRCRPLVAASIGPYGAYLANGAEYTGDYDLDYSGLLEFHRRRWQILAEQAPDLMLCETVPSFTEARVLADLAASVELPVWLSFCCRDEWTICDGTKLQACAHWLEQHSTVSAIGVNCVKPEWVSHLIQEMNSAADLPVIAFPNSGETYDTDTGTWSGVGEIDTFVRQSADWIAQEVMALGGCCRTTPAHIAAVRALGAFDK